MAAVLDRTVMGLADRGSASNMIGARWADVAAEYAMGWPGQERPNPVDPASPLLVERVMRLDDVPQVAATASRLGLQNPDLLLIGTSAGERAIQAADAKFSVETARSKQVSVAVVEGLLGVGSQFRDHINVPTNHTTILPGVFLAPDYPLTHLTLERRQGILRATVHWSEVVLVPVDAAAFFGEMEGAGLMRLLAGVDELPVSVETSLLAGLYYMRLARAAVGCWLDATKPLLTFQDALEIDEIAIEREAARRTAGAKSAFGLILHWNDDVEVIRRQRTAVEQAGMLPIPNRELRAQITAVAAAQGHEPPSVNQVRRRLGAWFRRELRAQVGPLRPPVPDLSAALGEVSRVSASIAPDLPGELQRIVVELGPPRPGPASEAEAALAPAEATPS